ncbi:MAG TPA: PfkB family carbohydrate kinase [Ilumatobacteraceae bacterium]|nr:PfkB family carbohydrate kinase [Ilumatobacteraceae bacterium]
MFDVCIVGSTNLDLVATAARLPGPGETVLGRDYAEHPGGKGLNQAVAAVAARVVLVTAGLPLVLKDAAPPKQTLSVKEQAS